MGEDGKGDICNTSNNKDFINKLVNKKKKPISSPLFSYLL